MTTHSSVPGLLQGNNIVVAILLLSLVVALLLFSPFVSPLTIPFSLAADGQEIRYTSVAKC
jgi:hypothetical protein